ncbi:MAG: ATP-binding protein [Candidatus Competibacteraceae bacterium]
MMTAGWEEANDRYLAAALTWLRLRLQRLAQAVAPPGQASAESGQAPTISAAELEQAAQLMQEAEAVDPPPALVILGQQFELSRFEQEVLLLCTALELDTRIAGLCALAQNNLQRPYPTFALALALFDEPLWEALAPQRPLRYWRLIEIHQPGAQPLTTSALRADERTVNYIKGLNYLDERLLALLVPFAGRADRQQQALPPSQQAAVTAALRHLEQSRATGHPPLVQLIGPDSLSKYLVALQAAARLGLQLCRLPASLLPVQAGEVETLARLWRRESLLLPVALYLDAHEGGEPAAGEGPLPALQRLLARDLGVVFLDTREIHPGLGHGGLPVDVAKPTPAEQRTAWNRVLPTNGDATARLAGQFNLNLPTIEQVAQVVSADPAEDGVQEYDCLWQLCLDRTRPRLEQLAQRLDPRATWDDIVLPLEQLAVLRQIAAQVGQRARVYDDWGFRRKMNRGLGISALFAGVSGTGKTMAAEVIASALRLNLYRIDLSAVVSKYIGETEKNLRRLFDAAEDGGAILLFDEADALFGKRSEVRDSHDRYANIEINYLLQRIEAYGGLAVLATNMKSALDQAFVRRLRFIVTFPFPESEQRKAIWQRVFPGETPTEGLDYDRLARLNLTGGSIHNIALNAAFLAAQAGTPVTLPLVLEAARTEFRKLEKPINEADFRMLQPAEVRR